MKPEFKIILNHYKAAKIDEKAFALCGVSASATDHKNNMAYIWGGLTHKHGFPATLYLFDMNSESFSIADELDIPGITQNPGGEIRFSEYIFTLDFKELPEDSWKEQH